MTNKDHPLPKSAHTYWEETRTQLFSIRQAEKLFSDTFQQLKTEPTEHTHYQVLAMQAATLMERTKALAFAAANQADSVIHNCEVAVQERLTHIEQPTDDPMPY